MALTETVWPARAPQPVAPSRQLERRLTAAELAELVAGYQAGATGGDLADRFGLARSSVILLLKAQGVAIRRPRLTDAECAQITALYRSGMRQIDIARQLSRDKGHVWHVLRRFGLV